MKESEARSLAASANRSRGCSVAQLWAQDVKGLRRRWCDVKRELPGWAEAAPFLS